MSSGCDFRTGCILQGLFQGTGISTAFEKQLGMQFVRSQLFRKLGLDKKHKRNCTQE